MPLLENLAEGLASAAGAEDAVGRIEKRKDQRQQLSDEERHANLDVYNQALDKLTTHIGQIDPEKRNFQNPEWVKLNDALHQTISARTALFHPEHGPGAMDKLAELLRIKKPERRVARTPGEAKASMADIMSASSMPSQDEYSGFSPADRQKAQRIHAGLDPRALAEKPEAENWIWTNVKFADGSERTVQRNSKSGEVQDLAGNPIPKEPLSGMQAIPKPSGSSGSKFNEILSSYERKWGKKKEQFTPEDYSYINQKIAHDAAHSGSSTAVRFEKNDQNQIVPVQYTNTRGIGPEPRDPNAKTATPRELKDKMKPLARKPSTTTGPSVKVGAPIMTAANPAANKADQDVVAATKLDSLANQAVASHEPVQQRQLALALIRGMAGRVNMQEFEQYTKRMGVANTVEGLINGLSTGEMPEGIVQQLANAAHANLKAAQAAKQAAHGTTDGSMSDDEFLKKF